MIEPQKNIITDESGLAVVEYAIAGSLITITLVGAFVLLSGGIESAIASIASALSGSPA